MNPKYLRVCSDLHLEAFTIKDWNGMLQHFLPDDPRDKESILLLAGDVSSRTEQLLEFLQHIESKFLHVLMTVGNHEYYHHDFDAQNIEFEKIERQLSTTNISCDVVRVFEEKDIRIIYGSLWGDGGNSLAEQASVGYGLNDFRIITKDKRLFTVSDMITINANHKNMIDKFLKIPFHGKTFVMTHHLPSYSLCHPRFGTDCNGGFASHCDKLLYEDWSPSVWVYGHTHDSQDSVIGNTRLVCNPAGYRGEWGSSFNSFHPMFIEI